MKNFEIGQSATSKRTFTAADLHEYASLAGIAQEPRTVPGPLLGGMFSYLLGTQLPGRGTNYLKQHLEFSQPAFVGDELTELDGLPHFDRPSQVGVGRVESRYAPAMTPRAPDRQSGAR